MTENHKSNLTQGSIHRFLEDSIKRPLMKCYETNTVNFNSGVRFSKKARPKLPTRSTPSAVPSAVPSASTTQAHQNAQQDAYAQVAAGLKKNPNYTGHAGMNLKKEFRQTFGDVTDFVTSPDGQKQHISVARARKKIKKGAPVIELGSSDDDMEQYLAPNHRAYNNRLDRTHLKKLEKDKRRVMQKQSPVSPAKTPSASNLPYHQLMEGPNRQRDGGEIKNVALLRKECLRLMKKGGTYTVKATKLLHYLVGNLGAKEAERGIYRLICVIAQDGAEDNMSIEDMVKTMLQCLD